jgi:hypothetical protein
MPAPIIGHLERQGKIGGYEAAAEARAGCGPFMTASHTLSGRYAKRWRSPKAAHPASAQPLKAWTIGRASASPPSVARGVSGTPAPTSTSATGPALDPDRDPNAQGRRAQFVGTFDGPNDVNTHTLTAAPRPIGGELHFGEPGRPPGWCQWLSVGRNRNQHIPPQTTCARLDAPLVHASMRVGEARRNRFEDAQDQPSEDWPTAADTTISTRTSGAPISH